MKGLYFPSKLTEVNKIYSKRNGLHSLNSASLSEAFYYFVDQGMLRDWESFSDNFRQKFGKSFDLFHHAMKYDPH